MRIKKLEEVINSMDWPLFETLNVSNISNDDYLIISAGFEDRAVYILEELARQRVVCNIILIKYLPYIEQNKYEKFCVLCKSLGVEPKVFVYDRRSPDNAGDKIINLLESDSNLFIDISGMSRFLIVQLLYAYREKYKNFLNLNILYVEAKYYPPNEQEYLTSSNNAEEYYGDVTMFLTSGIFDIIILPELSSTVLFEQPVRLIVFPSFNSSQMLALCNEIQPSYMTVIHGEPPDEILKWRIDAIAKINNIDENNYPEQHTTSTFDYTQTLRLLLQIYSQYGVMERIFTSPTGSKMQTLAIGIMKSYFKDINVVYPLPLAFTEPSTYTTGVKEAYCLDLSNFE